MFCAQVKQPWGQCSEACCCPVVASNDVGVCRCRAALWGGCMDLTPFSWVNMKPQVYICCTVIQAERNRSFLQEKNTGLAPLLPPSALPHLPPPKRGGAAEKGELPPGVCLVYCLHMPLGNLFLKSSDKVALLFPMARGQPE